MLSGSDFQYWDLRYAPVETRRMDATEHTALMAMFNANFWTMTVADINAIKSVERVYRHKK